MHAGDPGDRLSPLVILPNQTICPDIDPKGFPKGGPTSPVVLVPREGIWQVNKPRYEIYETSCDRGLFSGFPLSFVAWLSAD
jgi:hypothetical protein